MKIDFSSIDVETANSDLSSICQIGIVQFHAGEIVDKWKCLVNPQDFFDPGHVAIHGISESDVEDSPTFAEITPVLHRLLDAPVVCCHTTYDRTAIHAAHARLGIELPPVQWLDTARVVRRTWKDRARSGYGLRDVARMLDINFAHHDAEEDARVAGQVLLHAMAISGLSLMDWVVRSQQPISSGSTGSRTNESHNREGNPEGPLFGETAVFTGSLSIPRREAANLAAAAGCNVADGVNKETTLLIVGDQDVKRLSGQAKSSKHRKAESLIEKGQPIRVLRESDFLMLLQTSGTAGCVKEE